jgi:hypothetical protein
MVEMRWCWAKGWKEWLGRYGVKNNGWDEMRTEWLV